MSDVPEIDVPLASILPVADNQVSLIVIDGSEAAGFRVKRILFTGNVDDLLTGAGGFRSVPTTAITEIAVSTGLQGGGTSGRVVVAFATDYLARIAANDEKISFDEFNG